MGRTKTVKVCIKHMNLLMTVGVELYLTDNPEMKGINSKYLNQNFMVCKAIKYFTKIDILKKK